MATKSRFQKKTTCNMILVAVIVVRTVIVCFVCVCAHQPTYTHTEKPKLDNL